MYSIRGALIAAKSRATMFAVRAASICVRIYTETPKKAGITNKRFFGNRFLLRNSGASILVMLTNVFSA
jgi:hypothetical protein